jgi:uncharacterized protein (TIGR02271 family)
MDALKLCEGATVETQDGALGRLRHVVVGAETREVTELVVTEDGTDRLVPARAVADASDERIMLSGTRADYGTGASFDPDLYEVVDEDDAREETERRAVRGGEPLLDAREDEVTIGDQRREASSRATPDAGGYRLQLREERLRVLKEREQSGTVHLGKRVVERTETVNVPLREERVVIERYPVNEPATGEIADTGETIEVDLMRERAVAEKEVERTERVSDTLRKEELVVEEHGDVDVTGDANRARQAEYERDRASRS